MLNTVKKIGPVLELFTPERPEWRMTEIARALDMPKSSAHSLVTTLAEVGLLSVGTRGRYRLGWNLLTLAERMRASLSFADVALPVMQQLAQATKEAVLLAALDRHEAVYVERVEGTHPMVRLAGVRVGTRVPAYCTAVGKAMLAYRDPADVDRLLARVEMKAMTRNTITELPALHEELERIRAQGLSYDRQEIVPDVACVAAPIMDDYGSVVAAVSVSMPFYRFEQRRSLVIEPLRAAAAEISERLLAAAQQAPAEPEDALLVVP